MDEGLSKADIKELVKQIEQFEAKTNPNNFRNKSKTTRQELYDILQNFIILFNNLFKLKNKGEICQKLFNYLSNIRNNLEDSKDLYFDQEILKPELNERAKKLIPAYLTPDQCEFFESIGLSLITNNENGISLKKEANLRVNRVLFYV